MTGVVVGILMLLFGMLLGMLGGGAGILTVPMLVYVVGIEPKAAIAMSLLCVGMTSLVGTVFQARSRRVRWKIGTIFSPAAATGAFAGGRLAQLVPGNVLLSGLGVLLLVAAIAMLKGRVDTSGASPSLLKMLPLGACVGVMCSLVGAGGGFLVVPALTLFGGLAMGEAIGTSLFIVTLQSFAGFLGHASHSELDVRLVAVMTSSAVAGVVVGILLGRRVSSAALKRMFGWLVLAMGLFVLGTLLPLSWTAVVASIATGTALIVTAPPLHPPQSFAACQRSWSSMNVDMK